MEIANLELLAGNNPFMAKTKNVSFKLHNQRGCVLVPIRTVQIKLWKLFFDGYKSESLAGARTILEDPFEAKSAYSFQLDFESTNNRAEYEAFIIGLEILLEHRVKHLELSGDVQLVIKQLIDEYKCRDPNMAIYNVVARNLSSAFKEHTVKFFPREKNIAPKGMA